MIWEEIRNLIRNTKANVNLPIMEIRGLFHTTDRSSLPMVKPRSRDWDIVSLWIRTCGWAGLVHCERRKSSNNVVHASDVAAQWTFQMHDRIWSQQNSCKTFVWQNGKMEDRVGTLADGLHISVTRYSTLDNGQPYQLVISSSAFPSILTACSSIYKCQHILRAVVRYVDTTSQIQKNLQLSRVLPTDIEYYIKRQLVTMA